MDGIHDLGGKEGFGAIEYDADETYFHARWEARVFGLYLQRLGGASNIDRRRHAVERIDPRAYLDHGYYGRWLGAMETLLVEGRVLDTATIDARARSLGARPDDLVAARPSPTPDVVAYAPAKETGDRLVVRPPRFRVGDIVVTHRHGVPGHTRLPAYARGRSGRVVLHHDGWVFPDSNAHGHGEEPQHLYTVAFDGEELWGPDAEPSVTVRLDLFEPYLEPARRRTGV